MNGIIVVALPLIIMIAMTIVGLELTPADLGRVMHYPGEVAANLLGQALLLPLIAVGLITWLHPEPAVTGGLILAATAPQATSSNFFCLLGRANVALSVTLTAMSSVMALVSTPLMARFAFDVLLDQQAGFELPFGPVMRQVLTGLLLPVAAGMLVRHYAPGFVERHRTHFQRLTLVLIVAMLAIIVADQATTILRNVLSIVVMGVLFTAAAGLVALGISRTLKWTRQDTVTALAGFPLRSLSVATLISVNVLGRPDFLAFAAPFFVVQAVLLVPLMVLARPATAKP
jgi:BASS family bile acid:Na+ symporter